jgi:hypothetical protein
VTSAGGPFAQLRPGCSDLAQNTFLSLSQDLAEDAAQADPVIGMLGRIKYPEIF